MFDAKDVVSVIAPSKSSATMSASSVGETDIQTPSKNVHESGFLSLDHIRFETNPLYASRYPQKTYPPDD